MKTIALTNIKGGVGKTTSAINLAYAIGQLGKRVLLIDSDGQGHCSSFLGIERRGDLTGVLIRNKHDVPRYSERFFMPVSEFIQTGVRKGVDLIACDPTIMQAESAISNEAMRELRLHRRLTEVSHDYDICLIDVGPKADLLSTVALLASDMAMVVTTPSTPDASLQDMVNRLQTLRNEAEKGPEVIGVLSTQVDMREGLAQELADKLQAAHLPNLPPIPRAVAIARANQAGQTILEAAPNSAGARAYQEVAQWILGRIQ